MPCYIRCDLCTTDTRGYIRKNTNSSELIQCTKCNTKKAQSLLPESLRGDKGWLVKPIEKKENYNRL
jgi:hypothetical protein